MKTPYAPATIQLELGTDLVTRFRHEAVIRDMPVRSLILELLDVIVSDKLIDAILDYDAPAPPNHKVGRPRKVVPAPKLKSAVA